MMKYLLGMGLILLSSCSFSSDKNATLDTAKTEVGSKVMIPSPTQGSGKHTLTVFADFQCPACIAFNNIVAPVFEEYASKGFLVITYKQYPLTSIHPNAERDAIAALCSAEQGKFTEYKKALYAMEQQKSGAKVSDTDRINAAKGILDESKLTECLKTDKYLPQVKAEMAEGDALGVAGTPTVFLDGKRLDAAVYRDPGVLRTILNRLLMVPQTPTPTPTVPSAATK